MSAPNGIKPERATLDNGLPAINRFITTHNERTGKAVFSNNHAEQLPLEKLPSKAHFGLGYTTSRTPVDLSKERDVKEYSEYLDKKPGIIIPGGSVCRIVDMMPGVTSPMHRTVSLDYGVVLEGEVELVLDSGEVRLMRHGDVAVQRGTNHAWKNVTPNGGWARMLYVLQEALPFHLESGTLKEDYGDMEGVRASG